MGDVFCVAVQRDTLFVAGGFSKADNIKVHRIPDIKLVLGLPLVLVLMEAYFHC